MKTKIWLIMAAGMLLGVSPIHADTVWTEGYHEIVDGNVFGEIWMYNDATADILGGEIYKLETFDITVVDIFGGTMDLLRTHDNSIISIYGGDRDELHSYDNSLVYLYAYDVTYDDTTHLIEGKYYNDNSYFAFELLHSQDTYSHINVVPEPATLLLLSLGVLLVGKRR